MNKLEILWKEICFYLSPNSSSIKEDIYEQKILIVLEKMGWSHFNKEIILKKSIQIGSVGRIIPDIIVNSMIDEVSFVIEVKRPSVVLETESFQNQLFSYMRQLKLSYGLLIGNKIMIYYDGKFNPNTDPILLETIEIDSNDSKGLDFIGLFSKDFISKTVLEDYAKIKIDQNISSNKKQELLSFVLSSKFNQILIGAIKNELSQKWNKKIIDNAFDEISIDVSKKEIIGNSFEVKTNKWEKIDKSESIKYINKFLNKNIVNNKNLVFSNQNSANDKWWFEPKIDFFDTQSYIALYKYSTKTIYLFIIPKDEFCPIENFFHIRQDINRLQITINGNDTFNFRDINSHGVGVVFKKYLIETIVYTKEVK